MMTIKLGFQAKGDNLRLLTLEDSTEFVLALIGKSGTSKEIINNKTDNKQFLFNIPSDGDYIITLPNAMVMAGKPSVEPA